jgi:hypothetical protein
MATRAHTRNYFSGTTWTVAFAAAPSITSRLRTHACAPQQAGFDSVDAPESRDIDPSMEKHIKTNQRKQAEHPDHANNTSDLHERSCCWCQELKCRGETDTMDTGIR